MQKAETLDRKRSDQAAHNSVHFHKKLPCMAVSPPKPYICLLFLGFSNVYHFVFVWPTTLKLGCITNFDMFFLVMGFISLVDEIKFMLISSRHFGPRSPFFADGPWCKTKSLNPTKLLVLSKYTTAPELDNLLVFAAMDARLLYDRNLL